MQATLCLTNDINACSLFAMVEHNQSTTPMEHNIDTPKKRPWSEITPAEVEQLRREFRQLHEVLKDLPESFFDELEKEEAQ